MSHPHAAQKQKPAQTSCKAGGKSKGKRRTWTREEAAARRAEQAQQALANAVQGTSEANYDAIFEGFEAKGIDPDDVLPRENVFTFDAWLALGRAVRKGEHGVKVVTFIPRTKKDEQTGEEISYRIPRTTTVFHISQTEPAKPRH